MRLKKPTETDLVHQCLDYLHLRGIVAWRQNVGTMLSTYNGKTRRVTFGQPGLPDIIGHLRGGRALYVECKTGKRKITPEQESFLLGAIADGCFATVVYDVQELIDVIEQELGK